MKHLLPLAFCIILAPAAFAQTVERAPDGTPVAVTVGGTRYAIITIEQKRQALINEAKVEQLTALVGELKAQVADLRLLASQWQAQFQDSQKIVSSQAFLLETATRLIKAGITPKRHWLIAFFDSPVVSTVIKVLVPVLAGLAVKR